MGMEIDNQCAILEEPEIGESAISNVWGVVVGVPETSMRNEIKDLTVIRVTKP